MLQQTYPFALPPLPYPYDALEPAIDAKTMHYHHDKHFQTYVDKLNQTLEQYPFLQQLTLLQLLTKLPRKLPSDAVVSIMHNGGGVYNHDFYFKMLAPVASDNHQPGEALLKQLEQKYGTFAEFKQLFSSQAAAVFGSGWTCLALTRQGRLEIINLPNQDTVLNYGARPLLLFDVWEHAYYLKYKNARADYIQQLWSVVVFPQITT